MLQHIDSKQHKMKADKLNNAAVALATAVAAIPLPEVKVEVIDLDGGEPEVADLLGDQSHVEEEEEADLLVDQPQVEEAVLLGDQPHVEEREAVEPGEIVSDEEDLDYPIVQGLANTIGDNVDLDEDDEDFFDIIEPRQATPPLPDLLRAELMHVMGVRDLQKQAVRELPPFVAPFVAAIEPKVAPVLQLYMPAVEAAKELLPAPNQPEEPFNARAGFAMEQMGIQLNALRDSAFHLMQSDSIDVRDSVHRYIHRRVLELFPVSGEPPSKNRRLQ